MGSIFKKIKNNKHWLHLPLCSVVWLFDVLNFQWGIIILPQLIYCFFFFWVWTAITFLIVHLFSRNVSRTVFITSLLMYTMTLFAWIDILSKKILTYFKVSNIGNVTGILLFYILLCLVFIIYRQKLKNRTVHLYPFLLYLGLILVFGFNIFNNIINQKPLLTFVNPRYLEPKLNKTESKPNIYFLLFDAYTSSSSLKKYWNYDNPLDSVLTNKGFKVVKYAEPFSNQTPYSLWSIMHNNDFENNNAVSDLKNFGRHKVIANIGNGFVSDWLQYNNYEINNYGMFTLANTQPKIPLYFAWNLSLYYHKSLFEILRKRLINYLEYNDFNLHIKIHKSFNTKNRIIDLYKYANEVSDKKSSQFNYLHILLPHNYYWYTESSIPQISQNVKDCSGYLGNVKKANEVIDSVTNIILRKDNNAIVIVTGDHGSRSLYSRDNINESLSNFTAFYFPNKDYSKINDSIYTANIFAYVLNSQFGDSIKYIKTKPIYFYNM